MPYCQEMPFLDSVAFHGRNVVAREKAFGEREMALGESVTTSVQQMVWRVSYPL